MAWVPALSDGHDNFAPLTPLDWQVHVYGEATAEMQAVCIERSLPLHVFPWREDCGRAGLERDAMYLVRPDGHVGLAESNARADALRSYLDARRLMCGKGH